MSPLVTWGIIVIVLAVLWVGYNLVEYILTLLDL